MEAKKIYDMNQNIDLFIITHIDQDHIGGIASFIKQFETENAFVGEYWFNGDYHRLPEGKPKISFYQGIKLGEFLSKNRKDFKNRINSSLEPFRIYGAKFTILSPHPDALSDFLEKWEEEEKKGTGTKISAACDWDLGIEMLANKPFEDQCSLENRVSIAFLLELKDKSALFLGDAHPSTVIASLKQLGYSNEKKLKVDYIKVSHHGSKYNTNSDLLNLVDCDTFLISANGSNSYFFPHKEALARIVSRPERDILRKIKLIFNYANEEIKSIFTDSDRSVYNFECLYPKEGENGYVIECNSKSCM
jgi:beta-lactamase superfamily II metal-dependent hydrolase